MFRHQSAIFREIMNTQDHKSNIPHFIVLRILNTMEKVILDIADIFHVQLLLRTWMLQFSTEYLVLKEVALLSSKLTP
jgi:hypothetical protein